MIVDGRAKENDLKKNVIAFMIIHLHPIEINIK